MKYLFILITVIAAGCTSSYDAAADCYSTGQFRKFSGPSFSPYIMNVRSGSLSRVDIFIQMPFKNLRFEKKSDGFKASYSMSFIIRNEKNEIVQTKEIDRPVSAKLYEESVSSRMDVHFQSFTLYPSQYVLEVISVDNLSNFQYKYRERFSAADFSPDSILASSILFLGERDVDNQKISLRPILPASLSLLKDSLGMFQEIYHLDRNDTVTVTDTYSAHSRRIVENIEFPYLTPPYTLDANLCDQSFDSVYYQSDSTFVVQREGNAQYIMFHPLPGTGESNIVRTIIVRKDGKADTTVFARKVFRREYHLRNSLTLNEITGAMKFIMRGDEYDSLMAVTGDEKHVRIRQFWELRGGNERRTEFEHGITEANSLFTTCVDGSRTAMGIVYYICGVPDFIDCRGVYTETWVYNIGERAYTFQFRRDNASFQHYELTPYSVNESVWQYFVDRWRKKS